MLVLLLMHDGSMLMDPLSCAFCGSLCQYLCSGNCCHWAFFCFCGIIVLCMVGALVWQLNLPSKVYKEFSVSKRLTPEVIAVATMHYCLHVVYGDVFIGLGPWPRAVSLVLLRILVGVCGGAILVMELEVVMEGLVAAGISYGNGLLRLVSFGINGEQEFAESTFVIRPLLKLLILLPC
ncbi:hypothetical protein U1Q18_005265 [Sarracenia purpurea var. burkii]